MLRAECRPLDRLHPVRLGEERRRLGFEGFCAEIEFFLWMSEFRLRFAVAVLSLSEARVKLCNARI
jgi:hypothetical protein